MPRKTSQQSIEIRGLLSRFGLKAKKGLGQHFLIDHTILSTIVSAAEITLEDNILEIGPGLGILTVELARSAACVIAVEIDSKLTALLERRLSHLPNLRIINTDILKVNLSHILQDRVSYKVVANLPYYITSPILRYFIGAPVKPALMVVMVQKEVAESIVAKSGKMTAMAVSTQVYANPQIVTYVPAHSFYPQPKVDSAIVRIDMLPEPKFKSGNIDDFLDIVRCGFSSPRKQIRNSLAQGLQMKPAEASILLEKAAINPQHRPENLGIDEWERLYRAVILSRS